MNVVVSIVLLIAMCQVAAASHGFFAGEPLAHRFVRDLSAVADTATLGIIAQSNPPSGFQGLPAVQEWDNGRNNAEYLSLMEQFASILDPTSETGALIAGTLESICNSTEVPPEMYGDRCTFWRPWVDGEKNMTEFFQEWFFNVPIPAPRSGTNASSIYNPDSPGFFLEKWDWLSNTDPGRELVVNNTVFKKFMTDYLNLRGTYLSSVESFKPYPGSNQTPFDIWNTYNGTIEHPFDLNAYIVPDDGFSTYEQFFLKILKANSRPIGGAGNPYVIGSPCDCGAFYLSTATNSIAYVLPEKSGDMFGLEGSMPREYAQKLMGGPLLDFLLWFTDYHHFHAPVSGKVIYVGSYPGTYNYDFGNFDPNDPNRPQTVTDSNDTVQWYDTINKHRRDVVIIDNEIMGLVAFIPVGFWDVGSISVYVKEGDIVERGDYIGHFNYGGSSILLAFEPNQDFSFVVSGLALSSSEFPRLAKARQSIGQLVSEQVMSEIASSQTALSNCYFEGKSSETPVAASVSKTTSSAQSSHIPAVIIYLVLSYCLS